MTLNLSQPTTDEYLRRIHLVLDYIRAHVADDLSLDRLADVAAFSPFHFHRIFTALVGETVNQCARRLRLERAAALLKADPRMSIGMAALECGFESPSGFSRAFKRHFGITAREWDRRTPLNNSKNGQVLSGFPLYTDDELAEMALRVEIRALPAQPMAYIRVANAYSNPARIINAYERLTAWYAGCGGRRSDTLLIGMSQDDPEVTPLKLCRYDLCLTVPPHWTATGDIDGRELPACHLAVIHCVGDIYAVDRAWQYLYRYWLPRSRYLPDNLPAMEIYRRQPDEIGWETYDIDCAIPVVAMR
jgi:AraC family transcriptional regulator